MRVMEGYQLYFNWEGIRYESDTAVFKKAWLEGPVLQKAARIQATDFIDLDFTQQNLNTELFLPQNFFIARLRWKDVEYEEGQVVLKECTLNHNRSGSLKDLQDGYKFLIDCARHEEYLHNNILVYPSWVMNPEDVIKK